MKLDKRLNLVFPVQVATGTVHVHVAPLGYDVFRRFYHPLAATFGQVLTPSGIGPWSGSRVAFLILENIAKASNQWEGEEGVLLSLLPEMRQKANVVIPGPKGWEAQPFETAIATGMFDEEDLDQIMSAVVFFMAASAMLPPTDTPVMWSGLKMWDGASTSLDVTAWAGSLPTSTPGATT